MQRGGLLSRVVNGLWYRGAWVVCLGRGHHWGVVIDKPGYQHRWFCTRCYTTRYRA